MLIINCGSTSTKLALYSGELLIAEENIRHDSSELTSSAFVTDQHDMRKRAVLDFLIRHDTDPASLDIVISRGGSTLPVEGGAYAVNDVMYDRLKNRPFVQHAGILGPVIAREIADAAGAGAYVYDSPAVDEMTEIAKISGMKELDRPSLIHTLNTRYTARLVCEKRGSNYGESNIIAAHMGGGITIGLHHNGRITDVVNDAEGPFSPDRAGGVNSRLLVDLCFSGKYADAASVHRIMRGGGGVMSYLGTTDMKSVEEKADQGDEFAALIFDAMSYQIAKGIASLAPVVCGKIDFILLTGAMANSRRLTDDLEKRLSFLGPVEIIPGDREMEALHRGGMEILSDPSSVKEYKE